MKAFFREYVGEELMTPYVSYPDMKTNYSIKKIDLGQQPDHITPKTIQLFHEYGADLKNAKFF